MNGRGHNSVLSREDLGLRASQRQSWNFKASSQLIYHKPSTTLQISPQGLGWRAYNPGFQGPGGEEKALEEVQGSPCQQEYKEGMKRRCSAESALNSSLPLPSREVLITPTHPALLAQRAWEEESSLLVGVVCSLVLSTCSKLQADHIVFINLYWIEQ